MATAEWWGICPRGTRMFTLGQRSATLCPIAKPETETDLRAMKPSENASNKNYYVQFLEILPTFKPYSLHPSIRNIRK
ncbi:MAG: hypothetical protein JHD18_07025 [Rhodoferax sp.]|nr:hypothetical protein [Rhodoferax sp.]